MNWETLETVFKKAGSKEGTQVRFNDWNHTIKHFTIMGESSDGKRYVGQLDNGERCSYAKSSKGWMAYYEHAETQARAV